MPREDFNFDEWVESLKLDSDTRTALAELVQKAEPLRNGLADGVLGRRAINQQKDRLAASEKAVQEKEAALADLQKTFTEGGTKSQAQIDALKANEATLRRQLFEATEKLRTDYNAYGNADDIIKDIGLDKVADPAKATPPAPATPTFDASKYVPLEEFNRVRDAAFFWPAIVDKMRAQHGRLFTGKDDPMFDAVAIVTKVQETGENPEAVWKTMYGVPEREKAIERAGIEAEVRRKLEAEFQQRIDASATDPMRIQSPDGTPDPFMEALKSIPTGTDAPPLTPIDRGGQAGIEQAREVRKAMLAQG